MSPDARSWSQDAEAQFIDGLRARYENEGFTFTAHPKATLLPDFLGSYVPDALAQKPGQNIVIEVKDRRSPSTDGTLKTIRRLFEGHSDWQFHVVFMGADPLQSVTIPSSAPSTVRSQMDDVRTLVAQGHHRPAFIMAWSLLEAALRALDGETGNRPRGPGTVVQTLATNGYIDPDMERRMRGLIELRNRIVHGDLVAQPTTADVDSVLSAIDETLSAHVA